MEISGRQLDVRGKNSRQMSGLELQIWETYEIRKSWTRMTSPVNREQREKRAKDRNLRKVFL